MHREEGSGAEMEEGGAGRWKKEGGRWHRPEMNEEDGKAVSKFNLDAINKVINGKQSQ